MINRFGINKNMHRKEKYAINDVLDKLVPYSGEKQYVEFDGDLIKMESQRYRLFKRDGVTCINCNNSGQYFIKEKHKHDTIYHFNLYGIIDGNEVLFTKDHIIPKSKGGKNHMSNYQVMCYMCNHEKGNK